MARRVLIAGCGYVGLALARRLRAQGDAVWGLRRDPAARRALEEAGAVPLFADLTQPSSLRALPPADAVIAAQAPAGRDRGAYHATYVEGTRHLLEALRAHPPDRLVWISSTGVYAPSGGGWVDETTPPDPATETGQVLLQAEALVRQAPHPVVILRCAGIYGPGRNRIEWLRRKTARLEAAAYLNQIHVEDVAGLIAWVLDHGPSSELYLGVDDEPTAAPVFYRWLADQTGLPLPPAAPASAAGPAGQGIGGKRCSNRKITALGYRLAYPNYQAGYAPLIEAYRRSSHGGETHD